LPPHTRLGCTAAGGTTEDRGALDLFLRLVSRGPADHSAFCSDGDSGTGSPFILRLACVATRNIRVELTNPSSHEATPVAVRGGVDRLAVRLDSAFPLDDSTPLEALEVGVCVRVEEKGRRNVDHSL
jgi:hypothetical protein